LIEKSDEALNLNVNKKLAFDGYPLLGGFCCKSRKSNNSKSLAKVDLETSQPLRRFSAPTRRSVIDFGSTDMVPHIAARKTYQRLQEFSFATPKRLLQQYRPEVAIHL
jgi:hypothetical protein